MSYLASTNSALKMNRQTKIASQGKVAGLAACFVLAMSLSLYPPLVGWVNLVALPKFALLALGVFFALKFKVNSGRLRLLLGLTCCVLIPGGISSLAGQSNISQISVALLSFSTAFIFYAVSFNRSQSYRILKTIVYLPVFSVTLSLLFWLVSDLSIFRAEHTGFSRLGGVLAPAHLAMLCVVSLLALSLIKRADPSTSIFAPASVTLVILIATGGRTALFVGFIALIPVISKPKSYGAWALAFMMLLPAAALLEKAWDVSIQRSVSSEANGFNFSGRIPAWEFFIQEAEQTKLFGKGLGGVVSLTEGQLTDNLHFFKTPHNEYIRFYVDLGILAAPLFFLVIISQLAKAPESLRTFNYCSMMILLLYSFTDNTLSTPQFAIPFMLLMNIRNQFRAQPNAS